MTKKVVAICIFAILRLILLSVEIVVGSMTLVLTFTPTLIDSLQPMSVSERWLTLALLVMLLGTLNQFWSWLPFITTERTDKN